MSWSEVSSSSRPDSIPEGQGQATSSKRRDLRRHWSDIAKALPRGAALLEVGAGSCMVSRWMIGVRADLRVVATDCGAYPIEAGELGAIRFHGQTWLENLPFAAGAFNAVVSQFAFEYADRTPALQECARVLNDQGSLSFVMHADRGALYAGCALRVAAMEMIFEDPPLPDLFQKAGAISNLQLRSKMYELSIRARLVERRARLETMEVAAGTRLPGLRSYLDNAAMMIERPDFAPWVERANERLHGDFFMGRDQMRAAMSQADVDQISQSAMHLGLAVVKAERRDFYWSWSATKSGSSAPGLP